MLEGENGDNGVVATKLFRPHPTPTLRPSVPVPSGWACTVSRTTKSQAVG